MEKITETQETNLQRYLDGELEGPALQQFKEELSASPALQQRLERTRPVVEFLRKGKLETPSPAFVERVMRNLSRGAVTAYPSPKNGLMLLAGVIVASGMVAFMLSAGSFDSLTGLISVDQVNILNKYQTPSLPTININGKLIIRALIGINLVLAFIVLDRTVLRPFFNRRAGNA